MDNESKVMLDTINKTLNNINNRLFTLEEKISLMGPTPTEPVETPSTEVIRRKKINECLEELDFERIHNVMKMLNWQWILHTNDEDRYDVPTISYMKKRVKSMLYECYEEMDKNDEDWKVSTSGFTVRTFKDNNCEVIFELTGWYTGE